MHWHIELSGTDALQHETYTLNSHIPIGLFSHPEHGEGDDDHEILIDVDLDLLQKEVSAFDLVGVSVLDITFRPPLSLAAVPTRWLNTDFSIPWLTDGQPPPTQLVGLQAASN